jgi:guanylate kinase
MAGILFIISSPSGGGKGTLIREVLRTVPDIGYSVSYTTRPVRDGEVDGRDYFFVAKEKFQELIDADEFLEYANVHDNFYGTSLNQVRREREAGRDVILEIDVQGAELVKKKSSDAVGVFILPPSFEILKKRLVARQTESDETLRIRLGNSADEVREYKNFDYVILNDDIERAANDLRSVIFAERCRRDRQESAVNDILDTFE